MTYNPPYGPPTPPYGPPPPKKSNTLKIVLIVIGVIVALCCIGGAVGGYALYRAAKTGTENSGPARDSVNTFLGNIEAGQTNAAYDSLCEATKGKFGREQFAEYVAARGKLTSHTVDTAVVISNQGTASVNLTYADGKSNRHTIKLVEEGGAWKVCGNPY